MTSAAIYIVSGSVDIAGDAFEAGRLLVFQPGDRISILALSNARLMIVGGDPMDGPRHIWWNFVSSSKDRIDAAKADWKAGKFAARAGRRGGVHSAAGVASPHAHDASATLICPE